MGNLVSNAIDDAAVTGRRSEPRRGSHVPRHAAASERRPTTDGESRASRPPGALGRAFTTVRTYLPRGNNLDEQTFERRHLFLCWVLGLHVPALFALGVWRGYGVAHCALEVSLPVACVVFGRMANNRRLAAFFITAGLVYCSTVLVHLSGGVIEAHFHFFILIGLIALYQDWVPFLWNVVFTVLSHGLGSAIDASLMFSHDAARARPWTWAALHGVAVLAACVGEIIFWKHTELEQQRNVELVADLASADAARREAMSELLVNLARRNQSLLNRQLEVITDLELRERQPDVLEELFRLDHLATRIRRNAESLLVLSGDDPSRRWGNPVPLGDVVRAAAAEVEDYRRVEVLVNDHIEVEGRAVADLAHLLAELIENATTFSPPSSEVRVRSHLSAGDAITSVVSIEDAGIGMSEDDLRAANALLAEAPEVDIGRSTMLGFHVVARLSQRYGLTVRLAPTPGGGITAMVTLPDDLVTERPAGAAAPAGVVVGADRYQRAALASRGLANDAAARRALAGRAEAATPAALGGWAEPDVRHLPAIEPAVLSDGMSPWPQLPAATPEPLAAEPTARAEPAPAPAEPVGADASWAPAAKPPPEPSDWWWESEALLRRAVPDAVDAAPAVTPGFAPLPGRADHDAATIAGSGGAPAPATVLPELADGLVRRVPGAHLAPSLRRGPGSGTATPPASGSAASPADAAAAPTTAPQPTPIVRADREQVRSMLSRFQNSQRAARAATDPPAEPSPEEHR
jgi:signal transduction histidine kinase